MFKRKKERINIDWDNDSILLNKLIARKVNPVVKFYIEPYSSQKDEKDLFTDKELDNLFSQTSVDIFNSLNKKYVDYLESIYLSKDKVLEYIAEEVYYLLSIATIESNNEKLESIIKSKRNSFIQNLNKDS